MIGLEDSSVAKLIAWVGWDQGQKMMEGRRFEGRSGRLILALEKRVHAFSL